MTLPDKDVNSPARRVPFSGFFLVWMRVAVLSFGGPAGQIAVMHRILVDERKWISEHRFVHALNYCMLLPGPEAQQLATYIGWLLRGTPGGLLAGGLFVLPGFLGMLAFSVLYAGYRQIPAVEGLFIGVKAAVLAVVIEAVLRIGRRVLKNGWMYSIAAAAFAGIFFLDLPFPLIVLAAALAGLGLGRWQPHAVTPAAAGHAGAEALPADSAVENGSRARGWKAHVMRVGTVWLAVWLFPVAALLVTAGPAHVFTQVGFFFSKLALLSFGGAYAVLAWMAQEAVHAYGWLEAGEMLDGLGMAETMPGPLIKITQFVAFMGAFRDPGIFTPVTAGALASVLATWVTFAPSFLWIFVGAPWVETLRGNRPVAAALSGVTAAVVGVMLNLAAWFALHVIFAEVDKFRAFGLVLYRPVPGSFEPLSFALVVVAGIAILRLRVGMVPAIAGSAVLAMLLSGDG